MRYKSDMSEGPKIAVIATLVGDRARANILMALMAGSALTASELAYFANVTPQTASGHLAKLVDGGILAVTRQGRHRYFRLRSPLVGQMLEGIMAVAEGGPVRRHPDWRGGPELHFARVCYDHFAGELAVRVADALAERKLILLGEEGGEVTPDGAAFLETMGIDTRPLTRQHRIYCRPCLDWSMRRPHIAGAVGAALLGRLMSLRWLKRIKDSRALEVTPTGHRYLKESFGIATI